MLLQRANAAVGNHAVIRPGFWRLSAAGVAMILGSCSTILMARALGPALFGQYAFALWLATAAAPAAGAGMSALTSRVVAGIHSHAPPQLAAGIFYFVMRQHFIKMALYCLCYLLLILPCMRFFGANISLALLALAGLSAPSLLSGGVISITLRRLRRLDLLAAMNLLCAAITLLLVLLSIQATASDREQAHLFLLAQATASMLMLFVALLCIGRLLPLREARQPGPELKQKLARGLRGSLWLFVLDAIIWQHAELIALGRTQTTANLGFYLLSVMISMRVMQGIPTFYTTCVLPLWLRAAPRLRPANALDAHRRTTQALIWVAVPLCAPGILCCPALIAWCFGAAYLPLVMPLRIMLVAAAVGSISSASITRLAQRERKRAQTLLTIGAATLTLALAWPLIEHAGMTGAAIASATAQGVTSIGSILLCARYLRCGKAL